jgi:hypothetical protein
MFARMRSTAWLPLVIAWLVACQKPTPGSGGGPTPGPGFDERQACTADKDCAAVEIECCDHCNGGNVVGVHRDSADEVRAQFAGESKCGGTACTLMACAPATPICRQERCGVSIAGEEKLTPLPRP